MGMVNVLRRVKSVGFSRWVANNSSDPSIAAVSANKPAWKLKCNFSMHPID
jgi:hypothetical protein